jgi:hypothetical protein
LNPKKFLLPPLPQRLHTFDDDDAPRRPMPHVVAMLNGFVCKHGSTTIYGHFILFVSFLRLTWILWISTGSKIA